MLAITFVYSFIDSNNNVSWFKKSSWNILYFNFWMKGIRLRMISMGMALQYFHTKLFCLFFKSRTFELSIRLANSHLYFQTIYNENRLSDIQTTSLLIGFEFRQSDICANASLHTIVEFSGFQNTSNILHFQSRNSSSSIKALKWAKLVQILHLQHPLVSNEKCYFSTNSKLFQFLLLNSWTCLCWTSAMRKIRKWYGNMGEINCVLRYHWFYKCHKSSDSRKEIVHELGSITGGR